MSGAARRVGVRDRTWLRFQTVRVAGPLRVPPAERVRAVLSALAATDPGHPLLCRLDGDRLRPVPPDRLAAHLAEVVQAREVDLDALGLARSMAAEPLAGTPVRLVLTGSAAGIRTSHAIGDGAVVDRWFPALLAAAGHRLGSPGEGLDALTRAGARRRPLPAAVTRHLLARPDRAVRALRRSFPLAWPAPADRRLLAPGEAGDPTVEHVLVPAAELAALRSWRDRAAPGTSAASLLMAATCAALDRHGVGSSRGVTVMMDCRRYLGEHAGVVGNFATGPYLDVDPRDPVALSAAIRGAAADGVPLVLLAALTLRNAVAPSSGADAAATRAPAAPRTETVGVPLRPRIALTYQGRLDLDGLPWDAEADRRRYVIAAQPTGPDALTVAFVPTAAGVQVSVSLHPGIIDAAAVRTALAALAAPGGLRSASAVVQSAENGVLPARSRQAQDPDAGG